MYRFLNIVILLLLGFLMMGCQSQSANLDQVDNFDHHRPPSPHLFTAHAHPLGLSQNPDPRSKGHAYLLLGESVSAQPELAKAACETLFMDQELKAPAAALSRDHFVTYLPVNTLGDFRKVSSRFKWSMCQHLAKFIDIEREQALVRNVTEGSITGPTLLIYASPFRMNASEQALVVDLSAISEYDMPRVMANWKYRVASNKAFWQKGEDVAAIESELNNGLKSSRVAISILPKSEAESTHLVSQAAY